jgi:hypothetical protein
VIGVIANQDQAEIVEEFFQLFKTPWEIYRAEESYEIVVVAGTIPEKISAELILAYGSNLSSSDGAAGIVEHARVENAKIEWRGNQIPLYGRLLTFKQTNQRPVCNTTGSEVAAIEVARANPRVIRLGYDLFEEIALLLSTGQPVENALIPTLDLHIALLRDLILESGISLIEIPPVPAGHDVMACLTHDIDFVGIRPHKFDHSMYGFLYRSTIGSIQNFIRGRASFRHVLECWKAAAKLPFVYLGLAHDFWLPFEWYLRLEKDLSPTYFLIPFKHRHGDKVNLPHSERRGCGYDVEDIADWVVRLQAEGCEIGVHGIDAWHSVEKGREELNRIAAVAKQADLGMRSHWLLKNADTARILEEAGYSYDSTCGYNETIGFLNGTSQAFKPLGVQKLLELPMHIQDGALFFPGRLGLSDAEAEQRCNALIDVTRKSGGVLTLLWHDRSHGPERFWGNFYKHLVETLKMQNAWFGTAAAVVAWFRARRQICFRTIRSADGARHIRLCGKGAKMSPAFRVRAHTPNTQGGKPELIDFAWDGHSDLDPHSIHTKSVQDFVGPVPLNAA